MPKGIGYNGKKKKETLLQKISRGTATALVPGIAARNARIKKEKRAKELTTPRLSAKAEFGFAQNKANLAKKKAEAAAAKGDWQNATLWAGQHWQYQVKTADIGLRAKTYLEEHGAKVIKK